MDLSKPFFRILPEVDGIISWESNAPNDQHGNFAFDRDDDGSRYEKWKAYIAELDALGTRGNLVYQKYSMKRDPIWDREKDHAIETSPLSSYRMVIFDISDTHNNRS